MIHIYYIPVEALDGHGALSADPRQKREWMAALIESAASETNNPAAQTDIAGRLADVPVARPGADRATAAKSQTR